MCYNWNMVDTLTEDDLIGAAAEALAALPGVRFAKLEHPAPIEVRGRRVQVDALMRLGTTNGEHVYVVEAKNRLTPGALSAALSQLHNLAEITGKKPLLVTHYASEGVTDTLLETGVEFVDSAGNMHLRSPDYYVLVRGQKPVAVAPADAFTVTGLKVVYALVGFPELRRSTYRNIASAVGVGLGSVARTVQGLIEQGYIVKGPDDTLHLVDFEGLLGRWDFGYLETLRPRLNPTTWRLTTLNRQTVLDLLKGRRNLFIGGEEAAAALTGYLMPETLTVHVLEGDRKKLALELRALPTNGRPDLYVLSSLEPNVLDRLPQVGIAFPVANPILVRAELLALGGGRLREVAAKLLTDVILPELAHA